MKRKQDQGPKGREDQVDPDRGSGAADVPPTDEPIQQGMERGIAKDERVKRVLRQHPKRDEPRIDSVEPGETPSP